MKAPIVQLTTRTYTRPLTSEVPRVSSFDVIYSSNTRIIYCFKLAGKNYQHTTIFFLKILIFSENFSSLFFPRISFRLDLREKEEREGKAVFMRKSVSRARSLFLARGAIMVYKRGRVYSWNFLTTGTSSFLTSSTARASFNVARFSVSSTVSSTCNSSVRCSQFGLPRFCSSCLSNTSRNYYTHANIFSRTHTHTRTTATQTYNHIVNIKLSKFSYYSKIY